MLDAKSTIERLGGRFHLRSAVGEGTVAAIALTELLTLDRARPGSDELRKPSLARLGASDSW